jgi:hypothetical protein
MSHDRFAGVVRRSAPQNPEHQYAMERRDYRKRIWALKVGWRLLLAALVAGAMIWAAIEGVWK